MTAPHDAAPAVGTTAIVRVGELSVRFGTRRGVVTALERVSLEAARGEILGLVGESGSGKSVTSLALMGLLPRNAEIEATELAVGSIDIRQASERKLREMRGREMSMIFQNPRSSLNPIRRVGRQLEDVLAEHTSLRGAARSKRAVELLELVKIRDPQSRYHAYPFELSGGMCQRILIALALACEPELLIADEPTTGLDVTTQKTIMDLVAELARDRRMATLLITHDLGVAARYCDRIAVMQHGEVVESGPAAALLAAPQHPYTLRLIRATPRPDSRLEDIAPEGELGAAPPRLRAVQAGDAPLLEVIDLVKEYPPRDAPGPIGRLRGRVAPPGFRAVDGVSFTLRHGESLGLVGESGCGKSTTSSIVARILDPTSGSVRLDGVDLAAIPSRRFARSEHRRAVQMVFQDPGESLNPRWSAFDAIADPIRRLGEPADRGNLSARVEELAGMAGLGTGLLYRFPHQLSGGQKARVGIARAIALRPKLLILDEPTSALDVSVQAVVLQLLDRLRRELEMSYIFVSHDLTVVRLLCSRVMVMRQGGIVEEGPADRLLREPSHAYTRELLAAIPHFETRSAA